MSSDDFVGGGLQARLGLYCRYPTEPCELYIEMFSMRSDGMGRGEASGACEFR